MFYRTIRMMENGIKPIYVSLVSIILDNFSFANHLSPTHKSYFLYFPFPHKILVASYSKGTSPSEKREDGIGSRKKNLEVHFLECLSLGQYLSLLRWRREGGLHRLWLRDARLWYGSHVHVISCFFQPFHSLLLSLYFTLIFHLFFFIYRFSMESLLKWRLMNWIKELRGAMRLKNHWMSQ